MPVSSSEGEEQKLESHETLHFLVKLRQTSSATNTCSMVYHCVFLLFGPSLSLFWFMTVMPRTTKSPYPKLTSTIVKWPCLIKFLLELERHWQKHLPFIGTLKFYQRRIYFLKEAAAGAKRRFSARGQSDILL